MIGQTLEVAIVVSMVVLIAYPSAVAVKQVLQERHQRRVRVARRRQESRGEGL